MTMNFDNGLGAEHALDAAVKESIQKRITAVAEPLLESVFALDARLDRGIKLRQEAKATLAELAPKIREAYNQADEHLFTALAKVVQDIKDSLKAKRRA